MVKVSVIIPIYDVEKYIGECLESVIHQTLREIEIICVNDGTPDRSMEIVAGYADTDDRIVMLNKENGGLSSARNFGLRHARGEYVYFLDSDDYIIENALEMLYHEASGNQLDTLYFNADSFTENDAPEEWRDHFTEMYHISDVYNTVVTGQQLLVHLTQNKEFRPSACLQINRRQFLAEHGGEFEEGIIHEDNLFTLRLMLYSRRTKRLAESLYRRRVRGNSIMTAKTAKQSAYSYVSCMRHLIPEIMDHVTDSEVLDAYVVQIKRLHSLALKAVRGVSEEEYNDIVVDKGTADGYVFELFLRCHADLIRSIDRKNKLKNERLRKNNNDLKNKIKKLKQEKASETIKKPKYGGIKGFLKRLLRRIAPRYFLKKYTKVSIIMPVYNGEKYIKSCLDALRKQTLRDIEIICVDDASTDNSMDILNQYARMDYRIRVLRQEHSGAGSARNLGMTKAGGEYLLFLDCDDFFRESLCEKAYAKAKKEKADITLFAAKRRDMQTGKEQKMEWVLKASLLPDKAVFCGEDIPEKLFQITANCPWSKLFRKEFIVENGLKFQGTKHANDVYFVRMAMALAKRITVLDQSLVTYRYNEGTSTQSVKYRYPLEFYKAFLAVKESLQELGLYDIYRNSYRNWALTESLFNYRTMKTEEARRTIREMLQSEGWKRMDIEGCKKEDIYDPAVYLDYMRMAEEIG